MTIFIFFFLLKVCQSQRTKEEIDWQTRSSCTHHSSNKGIDCLVFEKDWRQTTFRSDKKRHTWWNLVLLPIPLAAPTKKAQFVHWILFVKNVCSPQWKKKEHPSQCGKNFPANSTCLLNWWIDLHIYNSTDGVHVGAYRILDRIYGTPHKLCIAVEPSADNQMLIGRTFPWHGFVWIWGGKGSRGRRSFTFLFFFK